MYLSLLILLAGCGWLVFADDRRNKSLAISWHDLAGNTARQAKDCFQTIRRHADDPIIQLIFRRQLLHLARIGELQASTVGWIYPEWAEPGVTKAFQTLQAGAAITLAKYPKETSP